MTGGIPSATAARRARIGVVGAVLLFAGGAWYQALVTPPFRFIDEQAHVGYVLAVQAGELPTIDTPIDVSAGGIALRERVEEGPPQHREVWVANNPPLTYAVAAGPAAVTRALGLPGGPLLGLRLVSVAAAAGAVALTYLLARDLAGGDTTVGLVAAGLLAALPHLGFIAALGFNDGVSLLATTGVLLALARVCGAGPVARRGGAAVPGLGLWCAACALARPMALVVGGAAVVVGLAVTVWRRSAPWPRALAWLAGPSVLTAGWFYVLSLRRYGDPTGSEALFEKFGRQPTGTLWSALTRWEVWSTALRTITTRRLQSPLPGDPRGWYHAVLIVVVLGLVGTAVLVVRSVVTRRGDRDADGDGPSSAALPAVAWGAVALVGCVPILLTAQHLAGGGNPHPRYLLPVLPVLVCVVSLPAVRLATRWTGAVLVVALAGVALRQTRAAAVWLAENPKGRPGSQLVAPSAPELVRGAGLVAAAVGLVLVIGAVVVKTRPTR